MEKDQNKENTDKASDKDQKDLNQYQKNEKNAALLYKKYRESI